MLPFPVVIEFNIEVANDQWRIRICFPFPNNQTLIARGNKCPEEIVRPICGERSIDGKDVYQLHLISFIVN